jgi:peptide-methionine (S)-S-oxide reductase
MPAMINRLILFPLLLAGALAACAQHGGSPSTAISSTKPVMSPMPAIPDTATFGEGCFWCTEACFQELEGVVSVTSGYAGGHVANPSYKDVCSGTTGHAEACQIVFDPAKISYDQLLQAFWGSHDPTTLNQQGNDVGTQYRSVIFAHNEAQRAKAEEYKKKLDASGSFSSPIVTSIEPFTNFYAAEDYHQNYFNENGEQPYCQFVVRPKVEKFRKVFHDALRKK